MVLECVSFLRQATSRSLAFTYSTRRGETLFQNIRQRQEWWRDVSPSQGLLQSASSQTEEAPERAKRLSTIPFPSLSDVLKHIQPVPKNDSDSSCWHKVKSVECLQSCWDVVCTVVTVHFCFLFLSTFNRG